jgi:hypothetical protein
MNEGKIRVLFGSTSMLGTGVNAQKRAVAVHHLDTPWRPSDLAQRDGRAIRKGNEIAKFFADNKVAVIIYAVEKSLDSYKFNLLYNKQLFIDQLKTNNLTKRTIDEGSMDEKSGMNFRNMWQSCQEIQTCWIKPNWKNRLPDWKAKSRRSTVLNPVPNLRWRIIRKCCKALNPV